MLRPSERTTGLLRALAPFLGGMALVLVPVAVLLLASVPVTALWNDLVLFPLTVFPRVRALPYPQPSPALGLVLQGRASLTDLLDTAPNWLPFYLPLAVNLVAAPVVVARLVRRDRAPEHGALAIGFLVLFAAASFNQARVRADLVHLVQLLLPSFVVLAWLLGTLWRYRQGLGLLVGLLLMPLVWLSVMTPIEERSALLASGAPFRSAQQNHGIERAEGMPVDPFQAQTIRYLQQVVPEGEPIYVGAGRHDRVFVNDVLLYFLANRPSATAYYELHPGLTTTEEVQTRILNDLDQKDVQYLIVYTAFDDVQEPNESATSSGVSVLDDYVRANYQVLTQFGPHYYVWKRR